MLVVGGAVVALMGSFPPDAVVRRDPARGTVRWAEAEDLGAAVASDAAVRAARAAGEPAGVALAVLAACADSLGLAAPADELRVHKVEPDGDGTRVRLQQVYRDVPVEGAELSVHLDADRRVRVVSGRYVRTPTGANLRPRLDAAAARDVAAGPDGPLPPGERPLLVLHVADDGRVRLAFRVLVQRGLIQREHVFVDAEDGRIVARVPLAYPAGGVRLEEDR